MTETFVENLTLKIKAGFPMMAVNSPEEDRCIQEIRLAGWNMGDGVEYPVNAEQRNLLKTLFTHYPAYECKLVNSRLTVNVRRLSALMHQLSDEGIESAEDIEKLLDEQGYPVFLWSQDRGFMDVEGKGIEGGEIELATAFLRLTVGPDTTKPKIPKRCITVFLDADEFLNAPGPDNGRYRRGLRMAFGNNRLMNKKLGLRHPVIFLQTDWVPHHSVAPCLHFLDFALPSIEHLDREVTYTEQGMETHADNTEVVRTCPPELRRPIVNAMRGFTQAEAVNAMALCVVKHRGFAEGMVPTLHRLKAEALRRDEVLEYIDADTLATAEQIGGFERYLTYVAEAKECYGEEAEKAGLKRPKGVLLIGPTGTGKTVVGMATARLMALPLVKYNFDAVFAGVVGESEGIQRRALRTVKALGPCVLLIDEADKAFAGIHQTAGLDSGVSQRVFMQLLSWMTIANQDAFVIMTMNRIDGIPPEMLRAGRLDGVWYTELPNPAERQEILAIHMRKNGLSPDDFDRKGWEKILGLTEDFVGAELEQLVIKSVRTAWKDRHVIKPTIEEVEAARKTITAAAQLNRDTIAREMDRYQEIATPVAIKKKTAKGGIGGLRRSVLVDSPHPENN